jgi:hypothetical protein
MRSTDFGQLKSPILATELPSPLRVAARTGLFYVRRMEYSWSKLRELQKILACC